MLLTKIPMRHWCCLSSVSNIHPWATWQLFYVMQFWNIAIPMCRRQQRSRFFCTLQTNLNLRNAFENGLWERTDFFFVCNMFNKNKTKTNTQKKIRHNEEKRHNAAALLWLIANRWYKFVSGILLVAPQNS